MTKKILNMTETAALIGVSIPTAYKMMAYDDFPKSLKPMAGVKTRRWCVDDVQKWLEGHKECT